MSLKNRLVVVSIALAAVGPKALAAEPPKDAVIERKSIDVEGANDDYTDTGLTLKTGDLLLVSASGKVVTGSWHGATPNPWGHGDVCGAGTDTDGALVMKIGTSGATRVGDHALVEAERDGAVKFKVRDTKYSDNSGKYSVELIRIPVDFPRTSKKVEVEAANDEWTPAEMTLEKDTTIVIKASGDAVVRNEKRNPDGVRCIGSAISTDDKDGALAAKIGTTTVVRAGKSTFITSDSSGPLKFRVRSGAKFEGNQGKYSVEVFALPTLTKESK